MENNTLTLDELNKLPKNAIALLYMQMSESFALLSEQNKTIQKQKAILKKYAKEQGFRNIQFFVDDGYSGANFNRPDWNRMIELVKDDKIGVIIAKDDCVIIELNAKSPIKCGFCAVSSIF